MNMKIPTRIKNPRNKILVIYLFIFIGINILNDYVDKNNINYKFLNVVITDYLELVLIILFFGLIGIMVWTQKGKPKMIIEYDRLAFYSKEQLVDQILKSEIEKINFFVSAQKQGVGNVMKIGMNFNLLDGRKRNYISDVTKAKEDYEILKQNGYPVSEKFLEVFDKTQKFKKAEKVYNKMILVGAIVFGIVTFGVIILTLFSLGFF